MRILTGSRITASDTRRVKPQPKQADAELQTSAHRKWRDIVLARAGHRCEWVEQGRRCTAVTNLVADHVIERKDGGALYDPANGQCLCTRHNTLKGIRARAARAKAREPRF